MRIGFLEPSYLWAAGAILAVIAIHLLKRPRTVKLRFSTLRFFSKAAMASNRSRRLKNILLFLARLLIVLFIVVIFARPYIKNDPLRVVRDPDYTLYVWVDPTLSMEYRVDGRTLGAHAHDFIDSLVNLRASGYGTVFLYNEQRQDFSSPAGGGVGNDFYRMNRYDNDAFVDACKRMAERDKRAVLLLLSDFQEPTTVLVEKMVGEKHFAGMPMVAVSFTPDKPWNCSVSNVRSGFLRETIITSRVSVYGNAKPVVCSLTASIDNIRTPPVSCTLSRGGDTTLCIVSRQRSTAGWGSVLLESGDPLSFDDSVSFITGRSDSLSVLVVGSREEIFPVIAAVKAAGNEKITSVTGSTPETVTFGQCTGADILIINGYRTRSTAIQMLLNSGSGRKQAVICAAGDNDSSASAGLSIPGLLNHSFKNRSVSEPLNIRLPDTLSELWRGFPAIVCREVRIYGYHTGLNGIPLLTLSNGEPLALEFDGDGKRKWTFFTSPLGISTANNLCETGFYVPMLDRILRRIISELRASDAPWTAGQTVKNPYYGKEHGAEVLTATGKTVLHLHRQPSFFIEHPGVYKIVPANALPWWKVVIPDTAESRLIYRQPDTKKNIRHQSVKPENLLNYLRQHGTTFEWLSPWILLMLLLLIELLLRDTARRRK
jgi:hypothetical protein